MKNREFSRSLELRNERWSSSVLAAVLQKRKSGVSEAQLAEALGVQVVFVQELLRRAREQDESFDGDSMAAAYAQARTAAERHLEDLSRAHPNGIPNELNIAPEGSIFRPYARPEFLSSIGSPTAACAGY